MRRANGARAGGNGGGRDFVDAEYFATLGIRVLAGRAFDSRDRENSPGAVVINRKMADQFWPGRDALGSSVIVGEPGQKAVVVGIVADGKYEDLEEPPRNLGALPGAFQPCYEGRATTKWG